MAKSDNLAGLRVAVLEPSFEEKRRERALRFSGRRVAQPTPSLDELKERLKEIRRSAVREISALRERFLAKVKAYPGLKVQVIPRAQDVASYIREEAKGLQVLSLNKSNVVINEIRPHLRDLGFSTYVRYFTEFKNFDPQGFRKQVQDYWALPGLHEKGILETFEVKGEFPVEAADGFKAYGAVLGVNVAAAEEGEVFFLQHMSNITKDLRDAQKLFFVVPIEKLVPSREEAVFQAKLTGISGLESVLLDLEPKPEEVFDFEALEASSGGREVHVILYDNGRSRLLGSPYEDLLLCIDCRACARQCPIGKHVMVQREMVYSPKNYLLAYLLGFGAVFETCLHCGRCEVECPVGIDIPYLVWRSHIDHYSKKGRGLKKRLLDNPELMAKLGTMMPALTNTALKIKPLRKFMEWFLGIHHEAPMPSFPKETFRDWLKKEGKDVR